MNTLKQWNEHESSADYDSKYVKKILIDVFGIKQLAKSSVFGTRARNSTAQHENLDATKLNFVRGKF